MLLVMYCKFIPQNLNFNKALYRDILHCLQEAVQHTGLYLVESDTGWSTMAEHQPAYWALSIQECSMRSGTTAYTASSPCHLLPVPTIETPLQRMQILVSKRYEAGNDGSTYGGCRSASSSGAWPLADMCVSSSVGAVRPVMMAAHTGRNCCNL